MDHGEIRHDLERGKEHAFEKTALYARVFTLADRASGGRLPRAAVPTIELAGPKITRKLTTEWFANRVEERYQRCLARDKP